MRANLGSPVCVSVCLLLPWPLALKTIPQPHGGDLTSFPLSQVSYLPGSWEILLLLPLPLPSPHYFPPPMEIPSLMLSNGKPPKEAQARDGREEKGESETVWTLGPALYKFS